MLYRSMMYCISIMHLQKLMIRYYYRIITDGHLMVGIITRFGKTSAGHHNSSKDYTKPDGKGTM